MANRFNPFARIGQVRTFVPMQRQVNLRPSDLGQEFSEPKQVRVPISSINTPKSFFNQLQSPIEVQPNGLVPLVTIAVVVLPDFTVLSFISSFSFTGMAPNENARQIAERTSRAAVVAIAYARTNPTIDEASKLLSIATAYGIAANNIGAQFVLQDDVSGVLTTSRTSATIQKSSSGTILFRRNFAPGRHVFTLGCMVDGSVGIDAGGASLYIQQSAG